MPGPIIVPQRPVARARVKPVQCWAHSKAGKRCVCTVARPPEDATPCIRDSLPVPLCRTHMSSGDGALKVVKHPTFGKILVARCDLPKGYRMVYWGYRKRCGYALDNDGNVIEDRAVSYAPSGSHNGVIDPDGTTDIMQFASCPGPDERQNCRSTNVYFGWHNAGEEVPVGQEFVTTQRIRKNEQLCHWYGPEWWSARNLKRANVGTKKYPAPLRESKAQSIAQTKSRDLKTMKQAIKATISKGQKRRPAARAKQT